LIPFNKPYLTGKELLNISQAHQNMMLAGDGQFTKDCHDWLQKNTGCYKALLTHSCTAALEMAAILANIEPGDEVIMPSYTFVSTSNAFVLRGGVPVFVDIRKDTLNIDEGMIEAAITPHTKAIVPVHYAGVACEMDTIMDIAHRHNLMVIEDAAQGVMSTYKGRPLGTIGHLGCYSFHETKNIISGEGGALLINKPELTVRAEFIRDKGTDRSSFFRGEIDKYTWIDIGSSYLPGEITAAFLLAQMEEAESITQRRLNLWNYYHKAFESLEYAGLLRRPIIPDNCEHNGHMYYLILPNMKYRDMFIEYMMKMGVCCVFHYIPLHLSPFGKQYCNSAMNLSITKDLSDRVVRLPLWIGMNDEIGGVIKAVFHVLDSIENN